VVEVDVVDVDVVVVEVDVVDDEVLVVEVDVVVVVEVDVVGVVGQTPHLGLIVMSKWNVDS
jgi:hypothetical protein